jgi:hypothetical protein
MERNHVCYVDGRIILKWIFKKYIVRTRIVLTCSV